MLLGCKFRGMILGGTQGGNHITLVINYFIGRPRVDEHGSEVCAAGLHLTGAAVQERGSRAWACRILG